MAERKTPQRDSIEIPLSVAVSTTVEAGKIAAVNAAGYVVPASDAVGLKVIGVFAESVDNSAGGDGDAVVRVTRLRAFLLKNSGTSPCTVADIGGNVLVADSETVAHDTTNDITCGKCLGFENGGVWTFIA